MRWMAWLYIVNTVFALIVAIREVRRPAKALNWLAIQLIVPVVGFACYLMISNPARIRRQRLTAPHNEFDTLPDSFGGSALAIAQSLRHLSVQGLRMSRVQMLTNGIETYERLIASIQDAERSIDLEYYIYRNDRIGRRITDLLIARAAAGIRIRFVRDGWGSRKFPRSQIARMMDAGVECRTIFPLRLPWILSTLMNRDHCKIVVIDGKEAFTGGINVGDEYTGLKPGVGFWRDTHMRIAGEAVSDLQAIFEAHWKIASPERMKTRTQGNPKSVTSVTSPGKAALSAWSVEWGSELSAIDGAEVDIDNIAGTKGKAYVQTFEGNPGIPTQVIRETYFICLTQASRTIDITTPYFVPEADIIMALKTAVARGVTVRLLVPRRVSPPIVGSASRTYYGELLEAGIHIYMYEKGMLHAKVMVVDGEIAAVGSANYDLRSYRLNYEVCEVLYSADAARELTEQFEHDLTNSVPLRMEELLQRSRSQRILDQAARLFSPLL